jgi:hypothetical protein
MYVLFIDKTTGGLEEVPVTGRGAGSISSIVKLMLDVSWYAVAFFLALSALVLCFAALSPRPRNMQLGIPVSFGLDLETRPVTSPSLGIEGARIEHASGTGTLNIPVVRRGGLLLGAIASLVVMLTLALLVLGQLRAVFRTLRDGRPFVPANARRIRWVGVGVILGELAWSALVFYAHAYARAHFSVEGIQFVARPSINILGIADGMVILAIAEVFKAGTRLEEDQSLTV